MNLSLFPSLDSTRSTSAAAPVASAAGVSRREALRLLGLAGGAALLSSSVARAADATAAPRPALPSLAGSQPGFYRFKVGGFEALALNDGGFSPPVAQSPFGVGEPAEAVAAELHAGFLSTERVSLPFNVLLVRTGTELVLVDAGCGSAMGAAGGKLVSNLAAAGVQPEQITGVILTHVHGDHFGGLLDAQQQPVFKNARHFVGKKEHEFWSGASPDLSGTGIPEQGRAGFISSAQACLTALKGKWEFVAGGDKLFDGLEILDTPGHTPGHLALLFSSGKEQVLHIADVAHSHVISFARPEWRMAFDAQSDVAVATRRKIFDRAAADRLLVFGSHMPFPALGHIRRNGKGGYEHVIAPWA